MDIVECVALLCCALCCMAVLCDLLVGHAFREALLCAGLPCCAVRLGVRGINGKQTQERRFMWACSVAAIALCCSRAVQRCALCACSWALGVHCCVLLYYRYALVLWCALRRVALLCCTLCCMAVLCRAVLCVRVCCLPVCVAAQCELLVRRAGREALLCAALPCCAGFCSAVRWNGREVKEK